MRTRSWALAAIAVLAALMRPLAGAEATAAVYRHITHLGWVVRDAEATAAAWRRLGVSDIGPARQERIDHRCTRDVAEDEGCLSVYPRRQTSKRTRE